MNIVLDIDGTLISDTKKDIVLRPGLGEFLDFCFINFKTVNIFTAAGQEWCKEVLDTFKERKVLKEGQKINKIFCRERCSRKSIPFDDNYGMYDGYNYTIVKRLKRMANTPDFSLDNTLIVDDTPSTYVENYGNAVRIKTYDSRIEEKDDEFSKLIVHLRDILKAFDQHHSIKVIQRHGYEVFN
jgi:TFIIF-interacting CTD phosphatase-like protein